MRKCASQRQPIGVTTGNFPAVDRQQCLFVAPCLIAGADRCIDLAGM